MKLLRHPAFAFAFVFALYLTLTLSLPAQSARFAPGKLAVLRVGDGVSQLQDRQNPVFIDEYDPTEANQAAPVFSVPLPTTGSNALWLNGNAYTEGGLCRSADRRLLTLSGYSGPILSLPGTPSKLAYDRGIGVVASDGSFHLAFRDAKWYGQAGDKTNPRGAVTDGQDHFWGCGNVLGDLFYNATAGVVPLATPASTRAVKIVNNILYTSLMTSDGDDSHPGGIYAFANASGSAVPLPQARDAVFSVAVPAAKPYGHVVGFDLSPKGDIAYMADAAYGIAKYVKANGQWQLACRFYIPGYDDAGHGLLADPPNNSVPVGCYGLVVDFSRAAPVLFATTLDSRVADAKNANANRLIRIDDTNAVASGLTVTNPVRVLAIAAGPNIVFRGLDFTPEARP